MVARSQVVGWQGLLADRLKAIAGWLERVAARLAGASVPTPAPNPLDDPVLELISDAKLVASVVIRSGRLHNPKFLPDLAALQSAQRTGAPSPVLIVALQKSLNGAIGDMAPITLADLRSGWTPHDARRTGVAGIAFVFIAAAFMVATLYVMHVYNQAVSVQAALVEVRNSKPPEKFVRLYDLVRSDESGLQNSIKKGNTGVIMEAFYKLFFDLRSAEEVLSAYDRLLDEVTAETERIAGTVVSVLPFLSAITGPRKSCTQIAAEQQKTFATLPPLDAATIAKATEAKRVVTDVPAPETADESKMIDDMNKDSSVRLKFGRSMGWTRISPYADQCMAERLFRLQAQLTLFGTWLLPGLFGMLGAFVFHMRRYLSTAVPNPNWLHVVYRVALGAFGGILVVALFYPSAPKGTEMVFTTSSAFAVAFLVGYSLDIFFMIIDAAGASISRSATRQ